MGRQAAIGVIEMTGPTDAALMWHLTGNHFPPVGFMFDTAKAAIAAANAGDWQQEVELPEGVTHKTYGQSAPAAAIIEHLHLEDFIETEEDEW